METICHLVAMEQILESLPNEICVWVREESQGGQLQKQGSSLMTMYKETGEQSLLRSREWWREGESTRGQVRGQENNVPGAAERGYSRQYGYCLRIGRTAE